VLTVCKIAFYLYCDLKEQKDDSWNTLKVKLLGDMSLLNNLKNYDITDLKFDAAKKAKAGIKQLKKDLGIEDTKEL